MCGIAGLLRPGGGDESMLAGYAKRMADTLAHRGPDAGGLWTNAAAGVAFGHRRLSILDLSEAGAQPMLSDCGRFAVTFNGEIYNHLDIRAELEAIDVRLNWRGHSDTETLLYAVRQWGIAAALPRFIGMFAFALWDKQEQTMTLCRDRFGESRCFTAGAGAIWYSPRSSRRWRPIPIGRRRWTAMH
jgi:asparagine synthase (glutamine-hydrolysing)